MIIRKDRLTRRIVLGSLLAAACLWYLGRELGFDRQEVLGFLGASVILVVSCAAAALVLVAVIKLLRR